MATDDFDDDDLVHLDHADGGFARDLVMLSRRGMFGLFARAAAGAAMLPIACTGNDASTPDGAAGAPGAVGTASCSQIAEETAGPYPGDGTNGPNALARAGIVRADIRPSLLGGTVAPGVPLVVSIVLVDATTCAPLAGRAVYAWHCDRDGDYSMYTGAAADETYLRGVQVSDDAGRVTFTTIFPGCYAGRWPHIHFEVYASLAGATTGASVDRLATSQLALVKSACDVVYASDGYARSAANLAQTSLARDFVFGDGAQLQLPEMTGDLAAGMRAAITVAIRT